MSWAQRIPAGVVGVISPFNFPAILAVRSVAPALALGNAVILKPDPRTAVSGGILLARLFEEAGLPAGVLHVLPGGADAGEALIAAPRCGSSPSPARPWPAGASASWPRPTSSGPTWSWAATPP